MRNGGSWLDSNRLGEDFDCSFKIVLLQIYFAELNQWRSFAGIQGGCASKLLFGSIQPIGFSVLLRKTQMRIVEVRGEFDRFFQPLDGPLRVVVLQFLHSLFVFLEGLFRDFGRQLADIYNTIPAQSASATAVHRASDQKNGYVWCPRNLDRVIHVFEAFQANANVVGAFRDVAELKIAMKIRERP